MANQTVVIINYNYYVRTYKSNTNQSYSTNNKNCVFKFKNHNKNQLINNYLLRREYEKYTLS